MASLRSYCLNVDPFFFFFLPFSLDFGLVRRPLDCCNGHRNGSKSGALTIVDRVGVSLRESREKAVRHAAIPLVFEVVNFSAIRLMVRRSKAPIAPEKA